MDYPSIERRKRERENDLSVLIGKVDDPTEIKRYRDVVRKAGIHGDYVIIGVEHQSTFDKNMIFRILNYDATTYINQVESKKEVYPIGSFVGSILKLEGKYILLQFSYI